MSIFINDARHTVRQFAQQLSARSERIARGTSRRDVLCNHDHTADLAVRVEPRSRLPLEPLHGSICSLQCIFFAPLDGTRQTTLQSGTPVMRDLRKDFSVQSTLQSLH